MPRFTLTEKAENDLLEIGYYTLDRWGEEQALKYTGQIDAAFSDLAENPRRGRECPEIRSGYRKLRVGRHLIFYHEKNGHIEIVRILHHKMNLTAHL